MLINIRDGQWDERVKISAERVQTNTQRHKMCDKKPAREPLPSMQTENRRSPRSIPGVQVGLMLLRDRFRPRGCHVRDYSEHGVLLKCTTQESPQEGVTLDAGDAVAVRFWDRNEPGRGGEVRGQITRLSKNEVAIEYSDSESAASKKLLDILTKPVSEGSIKADSAADLSTHRSATLENEEIFVTRRANESPEEESGDDINYVSDQAMGRRRILLGSLLLGVLGFLAMVLYGLSLSNQIDEIKQQVALLEAQQPQQDDSAVISGLPQRIARLEETQQQITKALSETAGQDELQVAIKQIELELVELKKSSAESAAATAAKVESSKPAPKNTEWVIHLVTLADRNAVENIITKAKTLGIDVHKSKVTVNDKQMHRLSIMGLSSRQDAEKLATTVQQQLALTRKPWIAKQ